MRVYVAIEQGWEHADILGIYLTKREAEQRCRTAHRTDNQQAYVVETYEIGATESIDDVQSGHRSGALAQGV